MLQDESQGSLVVVSDSRVPPAHPSTAAKASSDDDKSAHWKRDFGDLRELTPVAAVWNMTQFACAFLLAVAAGGLVWWHPAWYTVALALLVVPARQHCILNMSHECLHLTFVRGRRANELFGIVCASILGSPFRSTRAHHMAHHRLLATAEDPDAELHEGEDKLSRGGLAKHFASGLFGGYALRTLFKKKPTVNVDAETRKRDLRNIVVAQLLLIAFFSSVFSFWTYVFFWALPLATTTLSLHLLRSFCEHALLPGEEATYAGRLISCVSNPVERFFLCPFYMNYHSEHHLFPSIPGPRLHEAHARLRTRNDTPAQIVRTSYGRLLSRYVSSLR